MSHTSPQPRTVYLKDMQLQGTPVDFEQVHKILKTSFKLKSIQDIESIKIKDRKSQSGTISFYAYVTFKSQESANKALELRSIVIEGKEVTVEKRTLEKEFQLYIKNVGGLDEKQLMEYFGKFGSVNEVQLYQDFHGVTTGLIKFENPEHAQQLLKDQEQKINETLVKIEKFIPKDERREEGNRQLFLKKIPLIKDKAAIEQQLLKQFQQFGVITKRIQIDIKDGAKTATAIILYQNGRSLDLALESFNASLFGNNTKMELDYYLSKKDREQAGIIYLNNVKSTVDVKDLIALFSTFGKVETSSFNRSSSRGEDIQRGTITFLTKETMIDALAEWVRLPNIYSFFIDNKPKINIYQDRSERNDFMRTQRPIPQSQPQPQFLQRPNTFTPLPMANFGMHPLSMASFPPTHFKTGYPGFPTFSHPRTIGPVDL